jgi:hypothetical protein
MFVMNADDGEFDWASEPCPECGGPLSVELMPDTAAQKTFVALVCVIDGLVGIRDPFE